jgi:hypothetical protein
MPNRLRQFPSRIMSDADSLDHASEDDEPFPQPARPQARTTLTYQTLVLLSDTGAAHAYINKMRWLELLQHIATIGADGVLTAPADFLAVQLALYSGLAMSTELTVA